MLAMGLEATFFFSVLVPLQGLRRNVSYSEIFIYFRLHFDDYGSLNEKDDIYYGMEEFLIIIVF